MMTTLRGSTASYPLHSYSHLSSQLRAANTSKMRRLWLPFFNTFESCDDLNCFEMLSTSRTDVSLDAKTTEIV